VKRRLALVVVLGFLVYTGAYVFVYLFRAFRLATPPREAAVYVWHGDPMIRAVFVAVLFAIGLLIVAILAITRPASRGHGNVRVRADLWDWLLGRADQTNETPEQIADRAIAAYRSRIEGPSTNRKT